MVHALPNTTYVFIIDLGKYEEIITNIDCIQHDMDNHIFNYNFKTHLNLKTMPEFTAEVDIDPSEFIDSCSKREKDRLVEILIEDGYINSDQETKSNNNGVRRPNINDQTFWESLERLAKCRDLLSIEEENFINNLANKFKYIR
jgi:hypothetical protein